MLVNERLPKNMHIQSQNTHSQVPNENNIVWRSLSPMPPDELAATIRTQLSEFTAWPGLSNDLEYQDYRHGVYKQPCFERTGEEFLNSNAYQRWKNRKTLGPSLLCVSGSGTLCSDKDCCKSMGLTL